MRKLLSVLLVGMLTAVTAGCECWDCFMQFEAWKNQTLFGCMSPNYCPPGAAAYQYAPVTAYPDCGGVVADCGGVVVQSPMVGACGPAGCAPGVVAPGTYGMPGQILAPVPTPTTVVPGPETYAPAIQ